MRAAATRALFLRSCDDVPTAGTVAGPREGEGAQFDSDPQERGSDCKFGCRAIALHSFCSTRSGPGGLTGGTREAMASFSRLGGCWATCGQIGLTMCDLWVCTRP